MELRKAIASGALLLLMPLGALAQQTGFYVGGAGGFSQQDMDDVASSGLSLATEVYTLNYPANPAFVSLLADVDQDEKDTGWKVYAGWAPHEYTFFEAGFMDLGDAAVDFDVVAQLDTPPNVADSFSVRSSADGFFLAGGIKYPVSPRFEVFGQIGGMLYDNKLNFSGTLDGAAIGGLVDPDVLDDDGFSLMFGLGARYMINDMIGVRAQWEYLEDVNDQEIHLYSVGVELHLDKP